MKPIHYALFSTVIALTFSGSAFADEDYCESCQAQGNGTNNSCQKRQPQPGERINYRYKYRVLYHAGCYPYYHREYGVDRNACWASRKYDPFIVELER